MDREERREYAERVRTDKENVGARKWKCAKTEYLGEQWEWKWGIIQRGWELARGNEAAIFDKSSLKQTMKIDAITAAEKIFAIEGWTF